VTLSAELDGKIPLVTGKGNERSAGAFLTDYPREILCSAGFKTVREVSLYYVQVKLVPG